MSTIVVPLGELAEVVSGGTPRRSQTEFFGGTIPWVKIGDMLQGIVTQTDERITSAGLSSSSAKLLPAGTILLSIFATIGRTAVLGVDAATNQAIAGLKIRDSACVHPDYLRCYLEFASPGLAKQGRGVAQANINLSILRAHSVPLPSMEEQRRIAAELGAADALRAKRREALAKLDELIRSIFFDMFGDPMSRAKQLDYVPLGELVKLKSGAGLPAKAMEPGSYLVYGANGVTGTHTEYMFEESKIIIGRVGSCGSIHVSEPRSWITDNALYVSQMSPRLRSTYLAAALEFVKLSRFASQAAQPLISGGRVYPVEIPLPPLDTQQLFEQKLPAIAAHRNRMEQASATLDDLFASLQQRAFRGEL